MERTTTHCSRGVAVDITERKRVEEKLQESEEKYRSIFENVQDVYYEALIDGYNTRSQPFH